MSAAALEDVREVDGSATLEALARGEIDVQIRTAKAFPRSIKRFINEATDMACLDEATAESCMYALPRGGKSIQGPSARLAEIVASAWGNCRAGARVVSEQDSFVVAQGVFYDLERNVAITFESRRRITDKNGFRYNDDMIGVTANAACSIALRNAVFKGMPKAFWGPVYDAAKKTAIGDAKSLAAKRDEIVAYFGKMGVTLDRILASVGKPSLEDIGAEELVTLKGAASAIKEGEFSIEQAFPALQSDEEIGHGSKASNLADRLAKKQNGKSGNGESGKPGPEATSTQTETQTTTKTAAQPGEQEATKAEASPAPQPDAHQQQRIKIDELVDGLPHRGKALDIVFLECETRSLAKIPDAKLPNVIARLEAEYAKIRKGKNDK